MKYFKKIQEQRINSPRGAIPNPAHPVDITSAMKTSSTEGRKGIYTSTKGRNGGDLS